MVLPKTGNDVIFESIGDAKANCEKSVGGGPWPFTECVPGVLLASVATLGRVHELSRAVL